MFKGYRISRALVQQLSSDELQELFNKHNADIGWWTWLYGMRELSQDELNELGKDAGDWEGEWLTIPRGIKRAYLLSDYAEAFYQATSDLLDKFFSKTLYSDIEVLPILLLFFQFAELALKSSILFMIHFREARGTPTEQPRLGTHNLVELLRILTNLFEPEGPFLSEDTQDFIRKISEFNERAQAFRYPYDNRETRIFFTEKLLFPTGIFKREFEIHGAELNGFHHWLGEGYIASNSTEYE